MKKYLVICVSSESGVCSVDPFNTEADAQAFLKKDSESTREAEKESGSGNELEFDSEDDYAQLTDGEYSWNWTIHQIQI